MTGPDGFSGKFYQVSKSIIANDVIHAGHDFFLRAEITKASSASLISLIPKVLNVKSFTDFRPISLCNVSNKIL